MPGTEVAALRKWFRDFSFAMTISLATLTKPLKKA